MASQIDLCPVWHFEYSESPNQGPKSFSFIYQFQKKKLNRYLYVSDFIIIKIFNEFESESKLEHLHGI